MAKYIVANSPYGHSAGDVTMEISLYIVVYTISILLSTAILAASLFLVEDIKESSFKELGVFNTLARCAAIVVVTTLVALIPFGILIALVIWFVGIMFLFQKSFGQTFIVFLVNAIASLAISRAVIYLLARMLSSP